MVDFQVVVSRAYFLGVNPGKKKRVQLNVWWIKFRVRWGRFDTRLLQHDLRWNSKKWIYVDPKHCLNVLKRKSNLRTAKSSMADGNSNPKNTKITHKDYKRKQEETQRQGGLCRWWMGVRWAKREFVFLKFMIRHDKHKFSQEWFLWCTSYLYFYLYLYLCLYLYLYL